MMYRPPDHKHSDTIGVATSEGGVHWKDHGPVITDDITVFKRCVARCGEHFVLNHGRLAARGAPQRQQNRVHNFSSKVPLNWLRVAAFGNTQRGGPYLGSSWFTQEDVK